MMFKKDPIFWWASGIFILALVLFATTQNQYWLALMILSYLLRPTLASFGVGRNSIDERQLSLHYRSSNIAFAVMIIACTVFAAKLEAEGNHNWEILSMIIIIGVAVKALFNVILVKNLREGATKIIIAAGLFITLFVALDFIKQGVLSLLMNMIPGLAVVGLGILSKYYPRSIAVLIFLITIVLEVVIFNKGFNWAQIGTALIVGVPLVIAGVCLYMPDKKAIQAEPVNSG